MSTYCSMPDVPEPEGSLFFDVAYDCFGRDVRIILDGKSCYPTADEARKIGRAFLAAADLADESRETEGERGQVRPAMLYHWSPSRNRASIERDGLRPGSASNLTPEWIPPHICYGETPSAALSLTLLDGPLDLWMVRTDGHRFERANDGAEWRCSERVGAWFVGTRAEDSQPRDIPSDAPTHPAKKDATIMKLTEHTCCPRTGNPDCWDEDCEKCGDCRACEARSDD